MILLAGRVVGDIGDEDEVEVEGRVGDGGDDVNGTKAGVVVVCVVVANTSCVVATTCPIGFRTGGSVVATTCPVGSGNDDNGTGVAATAAAAIGATRITRIDASNSRDSSCNSRGSNSGDTSDTIYNLANGACS